MFTKYFEIFAQFVNQQDLFTAGLYMILAKIISGVTFVPGTPLTILSGALFGTFWGTIISIIGNLLGAVCAFFIARYIFRDFVQKKILGKYPSLDKFENRLFTKGLHTVIILRLLPIFPYNFLNFALAVTEVKFKDFFLGSAIGMIPGTIAFVHFGDSVKMLSYFNIAISVLAIILLFFLGRFLNK